MDQVPEVLVLGEELADVGVDFDFDFAAAGCGGVEGVVVYGRGLMGCKR